MTPDKFVARELGKRLKRVKDRIARLTAEAAMIERMLVDAGLPGVPNLKLRKNSTAKWTVRGLVISHLREHTEPVRAAALYDALKAYDPSLNPSTFRSHLKRMVGSGDIVREGARGCYRLVTRPPDEPEGPSARRPRRYLVAPRRST